MARSLLLASALLVASAAAQSLIPTTLPECAQQCSILIGAQSSCESNPSAAASCFCQNANLETIRTAPSTNLCNGFCSPTDWQTIANWYTQQACPNGQPASSTMQTVTTSPPATAASSSGALAGTGGPAATDEPSATSSVATAGSAQTAVSGSSSSDSETNAADYKNGQEWWNGHWQWIVMVIVLLIAFTVLGVGGRILFKRRQRRKNLGGMSGQEGNWAPNSSAHDFDTQGRQALAAAGPVTEEKREGPRKTRTLTRKLVGR